jgi:hypothetical protein
VGFLHEAVARNSGFKFQMGYQLLWQRFRCIFVKSFHPNARKRLAPKFLPARPQMIIYPNFLSGV